MRGKVRVRGSLRWALFALALVVWGRVGVGQGQPGGGEALFKARCASCHDPAVAGAPDRARLTQLGTYEVFNALKNTTMRSVAEGLSDAQLGAIATYLAPSPSQAAPPAPPADPPRCGTSSRLSLRPDDWVDWGRGPTNWRDQPAPRLSAGAVPKLKVKWAFAYYGGRYGQPTIAGGRVFLTSLSGNAYALDARSGCMEWRFDSAKSRTTVAVGRVAASPSGYAAFFGGPGNTVYAVDAATGELIWKQQVETHILGALTGAPVLHQDRLYVPLSSYEEVTASTPGYHCCTFRGAVVSLNASTGAVVWKTHTIDQEPSPSHTNSAGTQMYGPAGAAVWSAPTVDAKRGLLYVDTGDSYTDIKENGSDAVMAMDLTTGAVRWKRQVTPSDNYLMGCDTVALVNCPKPVGHDFDFGSSPILVPLRGGADVLIAGQKSGVVYGLSPEDGQVRWTAQVGEGGPLGGIEWGMATDGKRIYVANADAFMPSPPGRPGLAALDPATGHQLWFTPSPHLACGWTSTAACLNGISAAPTVVPGLVFAGDMNGRLRAYSTGNGRIVWEVDTGSRAYSTINGVPAQPGGNIDGPGPVVADGMLYVISGYQGNLGGASTNVLLAFSVDGK